MKFVYSGRSCLVVGIADDERTVLNRGSSSFVFGVKERPPGLLFILFSLSCFSNCTGERGSLLLNAPAPCPVLPLLLIGVPPV